MFSVQLYCKHLSEELGDEADHFLVDSSSARVLMNSSFLARRRSSLRLRASFVLERRASAWSLWRDQQVRGRTHRDQRVRGNRQTSESEATDRPASQT